MPFNIIKKQIPCKPEDNGNRRAMKTGFERQNEIFVRLKLKLKIHLRIPSKSRITNSYLLIAP